MTNRKTRQVSFEASVTVEIPVSELKAMGVETDEDLREYVENLEGIGVDVDEGRAWLAFVDADKAVWL